MKQLLLYAFVVFLILHTGVCKICAMVQKHSFYHRYIELLSFTSTNWVRYATGGICVRISMSWCQVSPLLTRNNCTNFKKLKGKYQKHKTEFPKAVAENCIHNSHTKPNRAVRILFRAFASQFLAFKRKILENIKLNS